MFMHGTVRKILDHPVNPRSPRESPLRVTLAVGYIYQQTFIDTYSMVVHCKLYTTKTPITAADLLKDKVLPF